MNSLITWTLLFIGLFGVIYGAIDGDAICFGIGSLFTVLSAADLFGQEGDESY